MYRSRHKSFAMGYSGPKNEGANNCFFCQGKMAFMAGVWYTVLKAFDVFQLLTHSKPAMTSSILFVFVPNSLPGASRYVVMRYVIWKYCRYVSFKALYVTLYYYSRVEIIWGIAPVRPGPYYGYLSPSGAGPKQALSLFVLDFEQRIATSCLILCTK